MNNKITIYCILMCLISCNLWAQEKHNTDNDNLIQFSGVILTADSLKPVSFTNILIKNSNHYKYQKGTAANVSGFFSFVANKNDTITFSAIGYKTKTFVIPDTIKDNKYTMIQLMHNDTIYLTECIIYPWPSKEEFKDIFINTPIPDDNITIAKKNLERAKIKEAARYYYRDGGANHRHYINKKIDEYYSAGQITPNSLLNPFAWYKFFKDWKDGKFIKDKELEEEIKRQRKEERQYWDYDEWIEKG